MNENEYEKKFYNTFKEILKNYDNNLVNHGNLKNFKSTGKYETSNDWLDEYLRSDENGNSLKVILPKYIHENIDSSSEYFFETSCTHHSNWAQIPYIVFSKNKNIKAKYGYYLGYYFSKNMNQFYLILGWGSDIYKTNSDKKIENRKNKLKDISKNSQIWFKENLNKRNFKQDCDNYIYSENFISNFQNRYENLCHEIDLEKGEKHDNYEKGTIFAIEYKKDKFKNKEISINDFLEDLKFFMDLYNYYNTNLGQNYDNLKELSNFLMTYKKQNSGVTSSNDRQNFYRCIAKNGYHFDEELVKNYLLSLKTKPFAILTGNSGTGKTKLAQLFAKYISSKDGSKYEIIPVGANWTDNRDLLGFENIITESYNSTPALDLILEAEEHPKTPYFLILDEMNLSHVERYFSDFLSAMESDESIPLFSKKSNGKDNSKMIDFYEIDGKKIHHKIKIPDNLFIIGTVNVDETTYMFSPKVLDRANVLEFKTDISYLDITCSNKEPSNMSFLENILFTDEDISYFNFKEKYHTQEEDIRKMNVNDLKKILGDEQNTSAHIYKDLTDEMKKFYDILKDSRFEFGYRTIDEILRYMTISWLYESQQSNWENWEPYFDAQIKQKILPKIHGSEIELKKTLEYLKTLCIHGKEIGYSEEKDKLIKNIKEKTEKSIKKPKYPESAKKLDKMIKVLDQQKYVSFIN